MTYANVKSILVLGDSVSKGIVLGGEKNSYIASKEGFIKKLKQRMRPEVFDYSRLGFTSGHGQNLLKKKFEETDADLVLIEYGNNDCDFKWEEVAENPTGMHEPNISIEKYTQNLKEMVQTVQASGKIPILTNLHPLCADRYFNWFTKGNVDMQKAVLKWLKAVENIYWWHEGYSYAADLVGQRCGVKVIDIRGAFLRQKNHNEQMCEDGIHPNLAGQKLIEDIFMDIITKKAPGLLAQGS